jgi:isopentenyl diphosphate isomerase/L-lactate dehydrogenase-like FMN-dependent dehydrogenase
LSLIIKADLERVMWLAGAQNIDDIKNINLRKRCVVPLNEN